MLVEVQYHDEEGSVCPFCGWDLTVKSKLNDTTIVTPENHRYIHNGYEVRLYPCECPSGHITFLAQQSLEGDDYEYTMRAFVFYQDWEDHIDMAITAGAYEMDLCDDEDDAWIIHREMNRTIKEVGSCTTLQRPTANKSNLGPRKLKVR
jgi:hypothetical protein